MKINCDTIKNVMGLREISSPSEVRAVENDQKKTTEKQMNNESLRPIGRNGFAFRRQIGTVTVFSDGKLK